MFFLSSISLWKPGNFGLRNGVVEAKKNAQHSGALNRRSQGRDASSLNSTGRDGSPSCPGLEAALLPVTSAGRPRSLTEPIIASAGMQNVFLLLEQGKMRQLFA
ncbi:MAG: hypothetical protein WBW41_18275 [Verrucomicrobiia bacterium]